MSPRAAVIGAGPSGLAAVKALKDAGIPVICFEQSNEVGGNWVYSDQPGHSSVYEATHIVSSKRLSAFSDFPLPSEYPDYPSHRQLRAYFDAYADHFGLREHIRFGARVDRAALGPDKHWRLTLDDGSVVEADWLLVASGHHWDPRMPEWPGVFDGKILHSREFRHAGPFAGQRVLIVGGGNSACDIAAEIGRVAEHTGISWRRGYYVVPKLVFGTPPDVLNARMRWLPGFIRRPLLWLTWRMVTGGTAPYGLPTPDHDILASHPVLNSDLLQSIRHGRITPYPDVQRLEGSTVHFADGRAELFDAIVAATGFRIRHPFLDPAIADFSTGDVPLYLRVFHPECPTLFFIGLVQPAGCIWPLAEAQSRLVAAHLSGRWTVPANVRVRIAVEMDRRRKRYTATPRHSVEVDFHEHLGELVRALPGRR